MQLFDFPELHEMSARMENKRVIWVCSDCGRKIETDPYLVIVEGNQLARHYGSMGGIRTTGVIAQQKRFL